jgi:NAD(P)-dependent dehydrogenase (short-subunit alcohol dehydrogenase family)
MEHMSPPESASLLLEEAETVIRRVVRSKLRVTLRSEDYREQNLDAIDLLGDIRLKLIRKLSEEASAGIQAAIHAWAKGLSREVGKHGITVNSIPPGRIDSEQIRRNYTPEFRQWQADNEIPVGRYGEPEDVAGLVCFLASPLAGYITGTVIPVDGGLRRYQF